MDFIKFITETGTNDIVTNIIKNNWILLGILLAPVGAWLKGTYPNFWAKLSTMIPFVGDPKRTLP
jgi:hypothetical protein